MVSVCDGSTWRLGTASEHGDGSQSQGVYCNAANQNPPIRPSARVTGVRGLAYSGLAQECTRRIGTEYTRRTTYSSSGSPKTEMVVLRYDPRERIQDTLIYYSGHLEEFLEVETLETTNYDFQGLW
jgi:hypothetical protein